LKTGNDVKKWWLEFAGIGNQYAKNIPMDEMDSRFMEFVKIDFRLSKIVDLLGGASLSASEKQELYIKVATKLNMSPWEIDRFCFNFYNEILSRIKLI
jgi:hypothetical protein